MSDGRITPDIIMQDEEPQLHGVNKLVREMEAESLSSTQKRTFMGIGIEEAFEFLALQQDINFDLPKLSCVICHIHLAESMVTIGNTNLLLCKQCKELLMSQDAEQLQQIIHQYGPKYGPQVVKHLEYLQVWHIEQEEHAKRVKLRYYKQNWNFNPSYMYAVENSITGEQCNCWEDFYELEQDPALVAAGITIGARLIPGRGDNTNLIVFRRHNMRTKKNERVVTCTHTAIWSSNLEQLPYDQLEYAQDSTNVGQPIHIDATEEYLALRSYVAGIAEVGLEHMFLATYSTDTLKLPFGFNDAMQKQILKCLLELAPHAAEHIVQLALVQILELAPMDWLIQRYQLLCDSYHLRTFMTQEFLDSMSPEIRSKAIKAFAINSYFTIDYNIFPGIKRSPT